MKQRFLRWVFMGWTSLFFWGCKEDASQTKLTYMPDMANTPKGKAQLNYLDPPKGSVPVHELLYPETIEEMEPIKNPLKGRADEAAQLANGEKLFNTYCTVCHGPLGKGDGTIVDKFPRPPDITAEIYHQRGDGFYFYRITHGSALMPAYGYATSPNERWQIGLYVRTLQEKAKQYETK